MNQIDLPDSLDQWYDKVSRMSSTEWNTVYKEIRFKEWYKKYKVDIKKRYLFWSDFPPRDGYYGCGWQLSEMDLLYRYSKTHITSNEMIYTSCAKHSEKSHVRGCPFSSFIRLNWKCSYCYAEEILSHFSFSVFEEFVPAPDVYCDNEELRDIILLHKPVAGSLFSHEVAMLSMVENGRYTTENLKLRQSGWHVAHPELLLLSLISRDYVKECSDEEFLDLCKMPELRRLLKEKGVKPGSSKENALERVKANFTGSEAVSILGFRYYVLSKQGKELLNDYYTKVAESGVETSTFSHWYIPNNIPDDILADCKNIIASRRDMCEISIVDVSAYNLVIHTPLYEGELTLSSHPQLSRIKMTSDFYRPHEFLQKVNVNVICNEATISLEGITLIALLSNSRKLIYGTQANNGMVDCTCIDLVTSEKLFEEQILIHSFATPTFPDYPYSVQQLLPFTTEGILSDGCVNYYVSPADELSELIICSYFSNEFKVKKVLPILENDTSSNYCISIPENDNEAHRLFLYMCIERKFLVPQMMGADIHEILNYIGCISDARSSSRIIRLIRENIWENNKNVKHAAETLVAQFGSDLSAICDKLKVFPNKALHDSPFNAYTSKYGRDENNIYVLQHPKEYKKRYDDILLLLKERGIIKSKWISEFSLYLMVKSYYEDTIYQYRVEWLSQQSLDLYIPSIGIAIEYQGQQHSEPVEYFGGEEHFQKTVERDLRKKALCIKNNVNLLYWNYDEPIEDCVLARKLNEMGIELPRKKGIL